MSRWSLVYDGYAPADELLRESLCTLGNGFFATRGAAPEAVADDTHYPGTYVAGAYNRRVSKVAGRQVENEDLVNMPNWLSLAVRIGDGPWFEVGAVTLLAYRQELDIRRGVLVREIRYEDAEGRRTRRTDRRLVHMAEPHLAALETTFVPENWSGEITVRSAVDGRVENTGVARYRALDGHHHDPVEAGEIGDDAVRLAVETNQSHTRVAVAARTRLLRGDEALTCPRRRFEEPGLIGHEMAVAVAEGQGVTIEKVIALYTSRDHAISEPADEAERAVRRAPGFARLLESHSEAWAFLWEHFDIDFEEGDDGACERAAAVLRLYIFHVVSTCSLNSMDIDAGAPARGLSGEAYRGHVFWDELFIFPTLNLRMPEITRALLMYRYRRLDEARAAARQAGLAGALYPWQSGSNGREESQRLHLNPRSGRWLPDNTWLQRHVNAAVVYNIWQYYQVTGDVESLTFYGAEVIYEVARFFASLATYDAEDDRYDIRGVMGPDEYHDAYPGADRPGLDNNAYTNVMAVWVLCRALELPHHLPGDQQANLRALLDLDDAEFGQWNEISRKMRVPFHDDGVISQFAGYDRLAELDWEGYREKYGDIQRLDRILEAEGDSPNHYKASKQADVLMLFYLFSSDELRELFDRLGYAFEYETIPKTIEYYLARTSHGSTLSRVVHSWVLARSDRARSWHLFTEALASDVSDIQGGTTPEGIHLGAMAGTADLVQRCYTGLEMRGEVLRLNPALPDELRTLRLELRYRGHTLALELTAARLLVQMVRCSAEPVAVAVRDREYRLKSGETIAFNLDGSGGLAEKANA